MSGESDNTTTPATSARYWEQIERTVLRIEASSREAGLTGLPTLAQLSKHHSEWPIRAACLRLLIDLYPNEVTTANAIASATHDEVDWVAFTAIQLAGTHKIMRAIPELIRIVGWPSNFTSEAARRKPVGCGAAFAKRALTTIFGSTDPARLRHLEDSHFSAELAATRIKPGIPTDTVFVPAGSFRAGHSPGFGAQFQLKDDDAAPRVVHLPPFYIDQTAVTNYKYRTFVAAISGTREFDHPDRPVDKPYMPAHIYDDRFNQDDQPVVGIDWYDAWSFAKWCGGYLPSEDEWEKAARGEDGRHYPWGDDFDDASCNYVNKAFGRAATNLKELEDVLSTTTERHNPRKTTVPANAFPHAASPYGAIQMSGNVWEMTRTNYYTRTDMDPFFKSRRPAEFLHRREAHHVLRGGSWSSPAPCLLTYFRGKDLITDKHNEVGFRCAYSPDH